MDNRKITKNTAITLLASATTTTPWSRVLLEKLTSSQAVKKFSAFDGIQRFITAFTSAHQLSLS